MDDDIQHDLTGASFDEFVAFLFDHKAVPTPWDAEQIPEPWYWKAQVTFEPVRVACDYARMFCAPEFLLAQFSAAQLEQGFWAIQSPAIECAVTEIIWHKQVPFVMREYCVRSMFHLFEKLFSRIELDTAPHMWWDSLACDWYCGNRSRAKGGEDAHMQDVMFETLARILALPSRDCQIAALHGLGHLHHPATPRLIERYVQHEDAIDSDLRSYAEAAARFDIL